MQPKCVNAPRQSEMAITITMAAAQNGSVAVGLTIALRRSIPATHSLRSRSPAPGAPAGNMEKSLCTEGTLPDLCVAHNPRWKHSEIALLRGVPAGYALYHQRFSVRRGWLYG